ncbi:MAG: copper transporter [Corynebacterium casei]|uniref:copper transporter n=1 Tax=Corynebacterium casei TaxID=160386 RepID=UPI002648B17B|nr:copper transporter [Corynebacterium casei]MDN5707341.1 copper transporter [Corynebacterium casei]MDN5730162.1 copper transporter [Corynebacterium casei]MDN5841723.1 copper transporter [Corynebacterium casei]
MAVQKSSRSALVIAGLGFGVALGVAAGTMVLAPNMEGTSAAVASDDPIREEHRALLQENKEIQAQSDSADSLISGLSADALAGSLEGRDVSIIATGDAAEGDVAGVRNMLNSAGAVDSGTITMTNEFLHPEGADKIKSIVANVLPAGAELDEQDLSAGRHTGQALAAALLRDPESAEPMASSEDRGALLQALREAGFLNFEDGTILPAQAVVVVMGRGGDEYYHDNLVAFANSLNEAGTYGVLAGRLQAAGEGGVIDTLRTEAGGGEGPSPDAISTVDSINRDFAQLAVALAVVEQLGDGSGAYGASESADAAAPPLPEGE